MTRGQAHEPEPAPGAPAVALHDLVVAYGDRVALHGIDLVVEPGGFVAVTGHSGAGKSTLLWAAAGVLPAAGGRVEILGRAVRVGDVAPDVALVAQEAGSSSLLSAWENVLLPLVAAGTDPAAARASTESALNDVGLLPVRDHLVDALSGGQQQRLGLAIALAQQTAVLLVDEPTAALAGEDRALVLRLLRARADAGCAIVMATHDPEAADDADAELTLDEGRASWVRRAGVAPA